LGIQVGDECAITRQVTHGGVHLSQADAQSCHICEANRTASVGVQKVCGYRYPYGLSLL